jgi:hypothetical protein
MTEQEQKELLKEFTNYNNSDHELYNENIINGFLQHRKNRVTRNVIQEIIYNCNYAIQKNSVQHFNSIVNIHTEFLIEYLNKEFNLNIPEK